MPAPPIQTARPLGQLPEEAPREVKGYSATELGLPRLTVLELGGLPPDVAERLVAELAADDPAAVAPANTGTGGMNAPTADGEEWDESRAYTAARDRYGDESRESEAYSAAYAAPRSRWDYSEELSALVNARRPPSRGSGRDERRGRWDEGESVELRDSRGRRSGRSGRPSRRAEYDDERPYDDRDDRYDRYDRRPSRGRMRDDEEDDYGSAAPTWLRPAVIAAAVVLLLVLGSVAVLKPEVCPISACASISSNVHKVFGGNDAAAASGPTASLTASPQQIQLSTTAANPVTAQLKLTNAGSADVTWQATSDLKWVSFTPANGTIAAGATATVAVQATPTGIAPGTYPSNVVVTVGGTTVKVPLQVTITASH
jgi:hypothetical protein